MPCPYNYNPADHYIHVLAVTPGKESECRALINQVCETFHQSELGHQVQNEIQYQLDHVASATNAQLKQAEQRSPYKASWMAQFKALMWRSFLSVIKEPMIVQVRFAQTIVIRYFF